MSELVGDRVQVRSCRHQLSRVPVAGVVEPRPPPTLRTVPDGVQRMVPVADAVRRSLDVVVPNVMTMTVVVVPSTVEVVAVMVAGIATLLLDLT